MDVHPEKVRCVDCETGGWPPGVTDTVATLINVHKERAGSLGEHGDWKAAETCLRCAVGHADGAPGLFASAAELRYQVGALYFMQGKYTDAERELVAVHNDVAAHPGYGPSAYLTGQTANAVGVVCKTAGRLDVAERYYQVAYRAFATGEFSDEFASVLHNLAGLCHASGESERGLDHGWHGLYLRMKVNGEGHHLVAADRANLAGLLHAVGRSDEAARQLELAIDVFAEHYGDDHPEVAVCLSGLASIDVDRGEFAVAEHRYRRAIDIKRRAQGDRHPDTLITVYNLGKLLAETGAVDAAAEILIGVVAGLTGAVTNDHTVLVRARELCSKLGVDLSTVPSLAIRHERTNSRKLKL